MPAHPEPTALARRWRALATLHDRVDAVLDQVLGTAFDLSARELRMLEILAEQGEAPEDHHHMKAIADVLALSQSATTRLVGRLEERGLVTRFICTADRRGVSADLTEAGQELIASAAPIRDDALSETLTGLSAEADTAPFVLLLHEPG